MFHVKVGKPVSPHLKNRQGIPQRVGGSPPIVSNSFHREISGGRRHTPLMPVNKRKRSSILRRRKQHQ